MFCPCSNGLREENAGVASIHAGKVSPVAIIYDGIMSVRPISVVVCVLTFAVASCKAPEGTTSNPETSGTNSGQLRQELAQVAQDAAAPSIADLRELGARCETEPATVTADDLKRVTELQQKAYSDALQAIQEFAQANTDLVGPARPGSDGGLARQTYERCSAAFQRHLLHPVPHRTETKDGRTFVYYAAQSTVAAWDDPEGELHYFGAAPQAAALTRLTNTGCDRVMLCGAGSCRPTIFQGQVHCALETIDPGGINAGGHYRLLRPSGWQTAESGADRVEKEMRSTGWANERPPD